MRILMLQTVEDSHPYIAPDPETGVPSVCYDVRKLYEGTEYSDEDGGPDFAGRAANLVRLGYAQDVTPA